MVCAGKRVGKSMTQTVEKVVMAACIGAHMCEGGQGQCSRRGGCGGKELIEFHSYLRLMGKGLMAERLEVSGRCFRRWAHAR